MQNGRMSWPLRGSPTRDLDGVHHRLVGRSSRWERTAKAFQNARAVSAGYNILLGLGALNLQTDGERWVVSRITAAGSPHRLRSSLLKGNRGKELVDRPGPLNRRRIHETRVCLAVAVPVY